MKYMLVGMVSVMVMACQSMPAENQKVDLVRVEKHSHTLTLYRAGRPLASYHVVFGGDPQGPKRQEGDERTPEGRYLLDYKSAVSGYHKSIHISYPSPQDIEAARKRGVKPGGAIMLHGQRNGWGWASFITQRFNWTHGCIALADGDLDQVWQRVEVGTPIEIRP